MEMDHISVSDIQDYFEYILKKNMEKKANNHKNKNNINKNKKIRIRIRIYANKIEKKSRLK